MQLQDILYSQGFGTRRVCAGLIQQGWVDVYPSKDAQRPSGKRSQLLNI
jgi:16S rRNA pseudouridine516 synthase